jgi:hypothetical protein
MRRTKSQPIRNKLDMTDRQQVRVVKKRLQISEEELTRVVSKIGNSISAISKEVALQRARRLPDPPQLPACAAILSVQGVETITSDPSGVADTTLSNPIRAGAGMTKRP